MYVLSHLSPSGGVVVQGVHSALERHRGQGPVHGLLPHQPEGRGGDGGGGRGHRDRLGLRALSLHGLILAAGGGGRGLQ